MNERRDRILKAILDNVGLVHMRDVSQVLEMFNELKKDYEKQSRYENGVVDFLTRKLSGRDCDIAFSLKYEKYFEINPKYYDVESSRQDIQQMLRYEKLDGKLMFKESNSIDRHLKQTWYYMISREMLYGVEIYNEFLKLDEMSQSYIKRKVVNMK